MIKLIIRELQFIDSFKFMVSSLDLLARNLFEIDGMRCEECRSEVELMHIDENYITHGMGEKC